MRILTVRQPWAWAIIHGGKDVENRVRNIAGDYRGPVAIHVAGKYAEHVDSEALDDATERWHDQPGADCNRHPWTSNVGKIIGVVDLIDVHSPAPDLSRDDFCQSPMGDLCSPWAELESWHLVLANPRPLAEPIPYRGALGLRKTDFGVEGDWIVEYHEPCKWPCAGVGYGCPPSCHMEPVARLVATS